MEHALGPAYARIWSRAAGDRRARRPHRRAGAGRGGVAQERVARRLGDARASRRASDEWAPRRGPPASGAGRRLAGWVGDSAVRLRPRRRAAACAGRTTGSRRCSAARLGTLVVAQALGGLGITVGIAVAAVLAEEISGCEALAGLVQTMQVLGAALASYLLAAPDGPARPPGRALVARLPPRRRRRGALRGRRGDPARSRCCSWAPRCSAPTTAANYQSRYAAADLAAPGSAGPGRCPWWCGRPPSARSPARTSPGPPAGRAERWGCPR